MSTATTLSASHNDVAFYRDRKAMLVYPLFFLIASGLLFFLFGGGKGKQRLSEELAASKPGAKGFNASVPTAKNGSIKDRDIDKPGYGKGTVGQVLSSFTNTRKDSSVHGLKVMPASEVVSNNTSNHASSLVTNQNMNAVASTSPYPAATGNYSRRRVKSDSRPTAAYTYNAPKSAIYTGSATDQQLAAQLRTYDNARHTQPAPTPASANQSLLEPISANRVGEDSRAATVQVSDNLTATRLSDAPTAQDAFNTAPTSGSRRQAERAVLSGSNSYGSKKTVAWMIPVVVREDQAIKEGQQVKLRLLKEIQADGVTIPANTILYAICQLGDDRLRLTVRSLQLGGQLIPLDLDVYDTDGSPGINVPGLTQSSQVGGQLRSSAIQGVNLPGIGGLGNTVLSSARMGASQSVRQATIRLKAGYNLFLKA